MVWIKRLILSLPFLIAALLTILIAGADRFHLNLQHMAGYGFMFGAPFLDLLDVRGIRGPQHASRARGPGIRRRREHRRDDEPDAENDA